MMEFQRNVFVQMVQFLIHTQERGNLVTTSLTQTVGTDLISVRFIFIIFWTFSCATKYRVFYILSYNFFITEPPQGPSDLCPRLNGFYSHPDPSVCHIFYTCSNGQAQENTCTPGLWFDEYTGVCNWPDNTDRQDCKADAYGKNTLIIQHNLNYKIV